MEFLPSCVHCNIWVLTVDLKKTRARILWGVLIKFWKQHATKLQLYGHQIPIWQHTSVGRSYIYQFSVDTVLKTNQEGFMISSDSERDRETESEKAIQSTQLDDGLYIYICICIPLRHTDSTDNRDTPLSLSYAHTHTQNTLPLSLSLSLSLSHTTLSPSFRHRP